MSQKNITKNNISLASQLLRLEEKKSAERKTKLEEGGTPTQALTPETNATRQMQQDVAAAMNKSGYPTPVGIEPKQNHGETDMGTQNVQGEDDPVKSADHGIQGQQDGMVKPNDQRGGGGQGPASGTTDMNATSGIKPKMTVEDVDKLAPADLIEAFVAFCGGLDEAVFKLIAEGISLLEAEAVLVDGQLEEGIFDNVKKGIASALGGEKKPSAGYIQHLAKRRGGEGKPKFVKDTGPTAGYSSTRNAGHDARRNK